MMIRGKEMALSLLAVGTAAVAGYALRSGQRTDSPSRSKANLGARIIGRDEVPDGATVVDSTSQRLAEIPGARRAIDRAVRNDAREEWEHVTIDRDGAWSVVDTVRGSLPYYSGSGGEYNGVYVHYNDRIVVLDAIGWARLEEPLH
ncbi:hypothetical protein HTZ84_19625 [Haloterrigena sp. SYSU A558-1]|uniref:Uncharacterized protein n=1 Tax=Haloterrigena gelatinilytica TaxID=2741724 RepID=A0A8J8GHE2_9EURY|nr:hypothetical protein [Haloterrigena gelatinilytica]NUB89691.1 hypothetical protein [Haloterrigena gelatinilytica]NUC74478.1 hypothetical protein [Haloterrigena gelatinilytica]